MVCEICQIFTKWRGNLPPDSSPEWSRHARRKKAMAAQAELASTRVLPAATSALATCSHSATTGVAAGQRLNRFSDQWRVIGGARPTIW